MKIRSNIYLLLSCLCGSLVLHSCKKDLGPIKDNLTVREAILSGGFMQIPVKIGTPLQINLAVNPGNRTVTDATYSNKHPEIATYSNTGLVTGLAVGKDTVTIRSGELNVWYIVNVTN
ncbi:Ig-like domain-containing protein [Sphingobacterium detergens]|uniref:Ig-like domain-containing protein n=1 Tax=Sphingobacterium detergens TaxID=1145106 RepID=UPI003AAA8611